jgi:uncharacterized protein
VRETQTLSSSIRRRVWEIADPYYPKDDWAHGRGHIERVVRSALEIGRHEGANLEVIELAAILHDILERKETHDHVDGFRHEIAGADEARRILKDLGLPKETIEAVAHCIEAHRKRASHEPQTLEAKCLFDADKLDCLGAIGVIRAAFVSFDHGQEFYKEIDDIDRYKLENIRPDGTIINFSKHSSNLEWDLSIKEVPKRMYTTTGKRIAEERGAFAGDFYRRYGEELRGIR